MKLVALSRRAIEASIPDIASGPPCAAICIAYPTGRAHRVVAQGTLRAVHHARFSDCDSVGAWAFPEGKSDEAVAVPMTNEDARGIVAFVRALPPEVETLYIACYGGVSRSTGTARGLSDAFGWRWEPTGIPNAHVARLIVQAAQEPSHV